MARQDRRWRGEVSGLVGQRIIARPVVVAAALELIKRKQSQHVKSQPRLILIERQLRLQPAPQRLALLRAE